MIRVLVGSATILLRTLRMETTMLPSTIIGCECHGSSLAAPGTILKLDLPTTSSPTLRHPHILVYDTETIDVKGTIWIICGVIISLS